MWPYKRDVDDPRESPSFELMELLGALALSYPTVIHIFRICQKCGIMTCPS